MQALEYNDELSQALARAHSFDLQEAYENVYKVVEGGWPEIPKEATLEVLFCYLRQEIPGEDLTMFTRHAFALVDGQIVEPLRNIGMDFRDPETDIKPIARLSKDEYLENLLLEGYYALCDLLIVEEVAAFNKYRIGSSLNDLDLVSLVNRLAEDDKTMATKLYNNVMLGDGKLPE